MAANPPEDRYAGFAERYDLFFERFAEHSPELVDFFRKIFARNRVRSVLDCACGTGRHLVLFQTLGLDVTGSDASPAMLTQARKNLKEAGIDVPLSQVDYRSLSHLHDRKFDAVTCLSSSLLEMADESEVLDALRSMRAVLGEAGILILSQGTTDRQWQQRPRFILAVNRDDFSRLMVIDYEGRGARYNVVDIFHGEGNRDLKVWSAHYHLMLLRDDLERLLREAGFSHVDFYGSYTLEPYDKTSSDVLIAVAHR
jgi:glycine/sarcosine N-methyltransferase